MDRIQKLHALGQSMWYDNIQRGLLENGEMADLIARGVIRGVTSNPSIFHNAIAKSHDYDAALKPMAWAGWSSLQIFNQLAIEDIRAAADLFLPLYETTRGGDGYVSLEVSPYLANDTSGTVAEAKRLWNLVNRPNLMIKIPATPQGLAAIHETISAGINVNVTLIFSLSRYQKVMDAYLSGLEERLAAGHPIASIASVASFFISRVDTKVDKALEAIMKEEGENAEKARALLGKAAIANARIAYALFLEKFSGSRFTKLAEAGAKMQRPLWASTSTKNPSYRDVIYVEELIGANTVNTAPPQTIEAYVDHGDAQLKLSTDVAAERQIIADLETLGISMEKVTEELEVEGVKAFADAFTALLDTLEQRRVESCAELGPLQSILPSQIVRVDYDQVVRRMFEIDPSLWIDDEPGQKEIRNRLGWLVSPEKSNLLIPEILKVADDCVGAGYTHALLLGMGGSSLAPEVLRLTFGIGERQGKPALDLAILDSTDPGQVLAAAKRSKVEKTLYIVSSKSGTTSEVNAFLDYFWDMAVRKLGEKASEHFVAVTDPGTRMDEIARERKFRAIIAGDPMVGGRYSALTGFGLLPAACIGMDPSKLLARAAWMMNQCLPNQPSGRNPGLVLGVLLGEAALEGRDKITILSDPEFESFGSWLEQLIAESTGKIGRGIIPIDLEPQVDARTYGEDRVFVYLRSSGKHASFVQKLLAAGQPVLTFELSDAYDLGAEFYRWEIATAIASHVIGVNGFDQPDVQDNKNRTTAKISQFKKSGVLESEPPVWERDGIKVYGSRWDGMETADSVDEVLSQFLKLSRTGDYIAINAYLPRNNKILTQLQKLRKAILKETGCATTLGFGPRFLHSTGQLHKGGPDRGVYIQITAEPDSDVDIPGQGISFGNLERAQALGDLEALLSRGRRAIRVHLPESDLKTILS